MRLRSASCRTCEKPSAQLMLTMQRRKWLPNLEASLEEAQGDDAFIAKALGDIARARGMSQVARDAGLSRESM